MSSKRKRPFVPASEPDATEDFYGPSRTEKRAERKEVQDTLDWLTKELCSIAPPRLAELALEPEHVAEITALRNMRKGGALARQRRYVASLLRAYDLAELSAKVDKLRPRNKG